MQPEPEPEQTGPTKGPWKVEVYKEEEGPPLIYCVCHPATECPSTTVCNMFNKGDADLIADAGTVYARTNQTPSGLLAQRDALLKLLTEINGESKLYEGHEGSYEKALTLAKEGGQG